VTRRLAVAALAACACHGSPATPIARGPKAPIVLGGDLDAAALLGDLPARAVQLGASPARVVASGPIGEGERVGAFVEVPADACLLGYARASSSVEDIDVIVFSDEGNPIAADEGPDSHPTVMMCPPHPDRVYLAVHAAAGEGTVALAAQVAPRDRAPELAVRLGARGSRGEGPRAAEAWPGLDERVRAHRTALGGRWEETKRVAVTADARAVTVVALSVEAGQCVDVLAVPDDSISAVDLDVTDGEGRVIARGRDGTRERTVLLCSATAMNGALHLRPHAGNGLAAVVTAKASLDEAPSLTEKADLVWYATTRSAEQSRKWLDAELAKAGYAPGATAGSGSLTLGRRSTLAVDAAAGGCSRVDVVAGAPLASFEARVWDDRGALVGAAEGPSLATVFVCRPQRVQLELDARGRPGPFAVVTRKERWQSPALLAKPLAASRMLARTADPPVSAIEGTLGDARALVVDQGKRVTWEAPVPARSCVVTAAGAEGEGTGLSLTALDVGSLEELDRSHASNAVRVRACAAELPRKVRYELTVSVGKLDVVVGDRRLAVPAD